MNSNIFDVIVIGAGHAGTEAALAASRMGLTTLLTSINLDTLGYMSCNPAIGGIGKGQLVKEIDALGGEMAKATDKSGIQFRRLNMSKGPAVRSLRAQIDRHLYQKYIQTVLQSQTNLKLRQAIISEITTDNNRVCGVKDITGESFISKTVVLCPGTFLDGLIHIGLKNYPGGRLGDLPSTDLALNLRSLGFQLGTFKTGTTPRIDGRTINFSILTPQPGDDPPPPFSFSTARIDRQQVHCYITHTNERTHEIIRKGLVYSPLYSGVITGTGVRYCPSIEDKIVKFHERNSHHVFIEPEGLNTIEYYPNGLSNSLPLDIQINMLRSIEGLENVEIIRPGYGIEHSYSNPCQLFPTLETKIIEGLYFAGQINGTTGYEEAAAQGLIAGINAALKVKGKEPLIIDRSQAYIGVLIDDLTTKGTNEPYRMFSSRCEYRLMLREDNADLRLMETGYLLGLVDEKIYSAMKKKKENINNEIERLKTVRINPTSENNKIITQWQTSEIKKTTSLEELLRRPEVDYQKLGEIAHLNLSLNEDEIIQVEIEIKYKGFIDRQLEDIGKFKTLEDMKIPPCFNFHNIPGLSNEVYEKLDRISPASIGQASRISGITPAAIWNILIYFKKYKP